VNLVFFEDNHNMITQNKEQTGVTIKNQQLELLKDGNKPKEKVQM
jgi:hypothetical protein